MNGDRIVERGATLLEEWSRKVAAEGGFGAKLAPTLADDAVFLRKLKPSLIAARLRGKSSVDGRPELTVVPAVPPTPSAQPARKRQKSRSGSGPNPLLVAAAAFAVGVVVAKLVDWRGHAHPRV
jgi:hypothetical protein